MTDSTTAPRVERVDVSTLGVDVTKLLTIGVEGLPRRLAAAFETMRDRKDAFATFWAGEPQPVPPTYSHMADPRATEAPIVWVSEYGHWSPRAWRLTGRLRVQIDLEYGDTWSELRGAELAVVGRTGGATVFHGGDLGVAVLPLLRAYLSRQAVRWVGGLALDGDFDPSAPDPGAVTSEEWAEAVLRARMSSA